MTLPTPGGDRHTWGTKLNLHLQGITDDISIINDYTNVVGDDAAGDGVTDDTAVIQGYLDNLGAVRLRPGKSYKVTTLVLPQGASLESVKPERGGDSDGSATLTGTAGYNVISLGSTQNPSGMAVRNLQIAGGLNGIASEWGANFVDIEGIQAWGQSNACLYFAQAVERWTVRRCWFTQSKYGVQFADVQPNFAQNSVMDKMLFEAISCTSNEYAWYIDIGNTGNAVTWLNCINTDSRKHGMYIAGTLQDSVFINFNNETIGYDNPYPLVQTTGTMSSSSTSLVVASATGWHDDEDICIAGAGVNGTDLQTTVVSRVGTTFTLADAASRSVTDARITNAIYDDLHMADNGSGSPIQNTFIGGSYGYTTTDGPLRYGVRSTGNNTFIGTTFQEPAYSPFGTDSFIHCHGAIRQLPTTSGWHAQPGTFQFVNGANVEGHRSMIVSGGNRPLQLWLADSVGNGSGTRDRFEVVLQDSNRSIPFWVDGDTYNTGIGDGGWDNGHLQLGAYHLWVDSTGDLRIKSSAPSSDTDGSVVGGQS